MIAMGTLRGYIYFPKNTGDNICGLRFEGIKTYTADSIEINGEKISAPVALLDGPTDKNGQFYIFAAEQIMYARGGSVSELATNNKKIDKHGRFILPLKGSQFDEGNYFSVKFRPDEMHDLTGVFEEASKLGGREYVLDVLIREAGKTDGPIGNSIYCLDVITTIDMFDFQDEARSILEERLRDTKKKKKVLKDLIRIPGLKRLR